MRFCVWKTQVKYHSEYAYRSSLPFLANEHMQIKPKALRMKNIKKYIIIFVAFSLILCTAAYAVPMGIMMLSRGYALDDEDFYNHQEDFDVAIDFLKEFIGKNMKNPQEEYICLGVYCVVADTIVLAGDDGRLEMDEKTCESLTAIDRLFSSRNCCLDAIRIKNNSISFDTIDGQYSIVYSLHKDPPSKVDIGTKEKYRIDKIEEGWYHRMPKIKWK